jgi:hypothetical protein
LKSIIKLKSEQFDSNFYFDVINSSIKIKTALNVKSTQQDVMKEDGDVFVNSEHAINVFKFDKELDLLLEIYNKTTWFIDRAHVDIKKTHSLNTYDKATILCLQDMHEDISIELRDEYSLLANIYTLLNDEQIGASVKNELHHFRKQVSYLFHQGPTLFTSFSDKEYFQSEVSKSITYLNKNKDYIHDQVKLEMIFRAFYKISTVME